MEHSILFDTDAIFICLFLFLAMGATISIGYYFGKRSKRTFSNESGIVSSLMGLFALLLAFSFGMSGSRFENRKNHLIDEVNAIGTALLRSDIYPDSSRIAFRRDFE